MTHQIRLFIGGEWVEPGSRDTVEVLNPVTEKPVSELCLATVDDLGRVLEAADQGFNIWSAMPAAVRGRLLKKAASLMRERADAIARVLTLEQGKTLAQAKGEVMVTAAYIEDLAECGARVAGRLLQIEESGVRRRIVHEPVGPVYAVSPWNLPAMMPGRKIGTTLAAGCSIILKPAKDTPQTAYLIAACCQDAGIPDGVVNVVSGPSSLLSDTLIASDVIRKISFTGSTEIGKIIAAQAGACMKKATLELGGHAPVIVCHDVDVQSAVSMLLPVRYHNAGQSCMATSRFFVHDAVYDEFVAGFSSQASAITLGDGTDPATDMGPLTSERRVPVMEALVEDARNNAATVTAGGKPLDREGYFFEATVLAGVPDSAAIMREEPFGPVTPIAPFNEIDDVIERANSTPYGLASYVFTKDMARAEYLAESLEAGLVGVNSTNVAGPAVPFGGVRDSGIGREGAMEGVLESMTTKTVSTASPAKAAGLK